MNTFDEMKGNPCVEFVDWVGRSQRNTFFAVARSAYFRISDLDLGEVWSRVLVMIWSKNIVAEDFASRGQFMCWLRSCMKSIMRNMRSEDRQRRGQLDRLRRGTDTLISDFEEEEWNKVLNSISNVKPEYKSELGPSSGWFSQAMDVLTLKQRAAIEMLVLAGMTASEAMPMYGDVSHRNLIYFARNQGLKKLRKRIESGEIDVGPGYRVA